jgi:hypothetical protein
MRDELSELLAVLDDREREIIFNVSADPTRTRLPSPTATPDRIDEVENGLVSNRKKKKVPAWSGYPNC